MRLLALASIALLGANAAVLAQDPATLPAFFVCAPQVEETTIRSSGDRFVVVVQLTETASIEWAAFTTEQLARRVQVKVGPVVVVEANVQTPIKSGLIEVARPDRVSAEALRSVVQDATDLPCGKDGSGEPR